MTAHYLPASAEFDGASVSEAARAINRALSQPIVSLAIDDDANRGDGALVICVADGSTVQISDEGRSCCEWRYITTDDDLAAFVGATIVEIECRAGEEVDTDFGTTETAFVIVTTTAGAFTLVTHNEHNGYYGGFTPVIKLTPKEAAE